MNISTSLGCRRTSAWELFSLVLKTMSFSNRSHEAPFIVHGAGCCHEPRLLLAIVTNIIAVDFTISL
jgi:hypothetical protein